jgi:NAD(P)-dependent dehydrogenase (short-subunit alcohol dehydrogenase family)
MVAVAGRDVNALHDVVRGFHAVYVEGDLREPGCAKRTVEIAADALGGLDVVVSNAGIGWYGPFASMSHEDIDEVLDVNLRSAAHLVRAALPHLCGRGARIVLTGSIAGSLGVSNEAWYSATKAALTCFAEVLRAELKNDGIGVTLVIPAVVDTQFFIRRRRPYPRRRPKPIQPALVAAAIANAIKNNDNEVVMPSWLWLPILVRGNFPRFYRQMESYFV